MTYADLIAEIKLLSKRYDIDDKIAVALRMTTLRAHRVDYFWRDLVEATASFSSSQEVVIDVSTSLTRFRQMAYARYYDPSTGMLGNFLEEIDPKDLFDEYNVVRDDRYYLAGVNLSLRFQRATSGAFLGYYQSPDVSVATYNSWIKDALPDILVQGSLAYLYNMLGNKEESNAINRMVGFEPDPANRAPGFTLVDQLRAIGLRQVS